jgi:hypothetical protein
MLLFCHGYGGDGRLLSFLVYLTTPAKTSRSTSVPEKKQIVLSTWESNDVASVFLALERGGSLHRGLRKLEWHIRLNCFALYTNEIKNE